MIELKEIMTPVFECLSINSTLKEAIHFMYRQKWNTVPVLDHEKRLKGVFTRSSLYRMLLDEKPLKAKITPYIKKEVVVLPLHISDEQLRLLVKKSKVGTGVVVDEEGYVVGLMTKTDFVNALLNDTELLKEQLKTVLDHSTFGVLMTDNINRITYVNEVLCQMINKKLDEVINQPLDSIIDLPAENHKPIKMKFYNGQSIVRKTSYNMTNGKTGVIALFQHITEVEEMAEELESVKHLKRLLETVIDHAYDGIIMINECGEVTFFNQPIVDLFELDKHLIKNKNIQDILPELQLTNVLQTGIAEFSDFQEVKGIKYIVHRIPVYEGDKIIGVIGKVFYRQLHEVLNQIKKLDIHKQKESRKHAKSLSAKFSVDQIKTKNEKMNKLLKSARKAAKGKSTILIRGESGTGKELLAHAIHSMSLRKEGPFVSINCAAIPEHLLESEFFGYEGGAFTGANHKGKIGKFELANGGTLFLDEVGDMSLSLQAKLLRALQEKEFYRVGGNERISVDVRIIAASHQPLEEMVEKGAFREDLYYRLNVISFEIPPLRIRKDDILLLCESFLPEINEENGTSVFGMSPAVKEIMVQYDWPGNIRELRNVLERSMIFAEHGKIQLEDLPEYIRKKINMKSTNQLGVEVKENQTLIEQAEKKAIEQALQEAVGNKSKASKLLGISRSVLYKKMKKYNL